MNTRKIILSAALAAFGSLCSCTYQVDVISEQDTPVRTTVTPALPLFIDSGSETIELSYGINSTPVPSSSVGSTSSNLTKTDDELLAEGYVLQFSSVGMMMAKESFSLVAGEALKPHLTTGLGQTIYVVSNCGDLDISSVKDLAGFQSFTYPVDLIKTEDDIPLVGCVEGVNIEDDGSGNGKLSYKDGTPVTVTMKQIASKVELSYSFDIEDLALSSISIVDAPSSIPLLPPAADGVLTFYPEAIVESNFKTETVELADEAAKSGNLSWFISDNIRGTVLSSSSEREKNHATAPSKSTYICFEAHAADDDNTYKFSFYPGDDITSDFNIRRGNVYRMNVSIASKDPLLDRRISVVVPSITDPTILEKHNYAAPANCYVVKPGEQVIIGYRAGADGGVNPYTETAVIKDAVIVWQTKESGQLALGNQSDVLELGYDEEYGDDLLTVRTNHEGNALVAVRDEIGNILWSWHIWVTDYNPDETNLEYNNSIWMDRSLGALNMKKDESRTEGWLYQWGRKDPFPPIDYLELLEEGSINHAIVLYDGQGAILPDVDVTEGDSQIAKMDVGTADSNLEYSIAHPMTFIYNSTASESNTNSACIHWISSKHTADATSMTLWSGDTKTVFDPCPAGWIISSTNFFSIDPPKHNSLTYTANAISSYASSDNPQERGAYLNVLDNETVWVPFQGYRRCTKSGATVNCGDVAVFWTGNNQDDYRTWAMKFRAADMRTMVTYPRSNGLCVRCVKVTK